MTERVRRSSRIPKQVAIVLVGSDMEGRGFSEKTHTVVLSRHGGGIVSEYALSAEQELVIRLTDSKKEAEVRVVGQLATQDGKYIYGVAFLDPNMNFWGIEFPALSDSEKEAARKILECSSCKTRERVEHSDVEADVFAINEGVIRFCRNCGSSTMWRLPSGNADAAEMESGNPVGNLEPEPPPSAPATLVAAPIEQPPGAPASMTLEPVAATETTSASVRLENRRKHVRTTVAFKACVRSQGSANDIVTCENISRGGLQFKSKKRYTEKQLIDVSAPYAAGSQNIFVSARIVYVFELTKEKLFRYGAEYVGSKKA